MINLVYNELVKLMGKRKLLVVALIIGVLIALFTYAQYRQAEETARRYGNVDWRTTMELQIRHWENRMSSIRTSEEQRQQLSIRIEQSRYYLEQNINPTEPGAPTFVREFIKSGSSLLLPLMMLVVASDLVSSEHSAGTMKALLTRPVRRWRILTAKYITLVLSVSLILAVFGVLSVVIAGGVFGFQGWSAPVLMGFSTTEGALDTTNVQMVPQWRYLLMLYGLAWFVSLVVATLAFMLSVLIRSTAAGMGIMLASLIAGMILRQMVSSWEAAKYFFMVNLQLLDYLENAAPPIEGMSLGFSFMVLLAWGAAALTVSYFSFTRRDVY